MHRHHRHHHPRTVIAAGWLLAVTVGGIAALVVVFGRGGGVSEGAPPPRPTSLVSGRALDFTRDGGQLPPVFVERALEGGWAYRYRIQGEFFREQDFLGLCRAIARNTPDMAVHLVPHTAMSEDEIGLVSSRIRENGLVNVHVARSLGGSDFR